MSVVRVCLNTATSPSGYWLITLSLCVWVADRKAIDIVDDMAPIHLPLPYVKTQSIQEEKEHFVCQTAFLSEGFCLPQLICSAGKANIGKTKLTYLFGGTNFELFGLKEWLIDLLVAIYLLMLCRNFSIKSVHVVKRSYSYVQRTAWKNYEYTLFKNDIFYLKFMISGFHKDDPQVFSLKVSILNILTIMHGCLGGHWV